MRLYIAIRLNYGFQGSRKAVKRKGKLFQVAFTQKLCVVCRYNQLIKQVYSNNGWPQQFVNIAIHSAYCNRLREITPAVSILFIY